MGFGTEELEGLRRRVQLQLVLLQQQLTTAGRIEQDLLALAQKMVRISKSLPARHAERVRLLRAALDGSARARDYLEDEIGQAFEAAERAREEEDRIPGEARDPGNDERAPSRIGVSSPDGLLADVRLGDTLLFSAVGLRYAVRGPVHPVALGTLDSAQLDDAFPRVDLPGAIGLGRPGRPRILLCERVLGRIRRGPRGGEFKLEPLNRAHPAIAGRFRLRGHWYYLLR